MKIDIIYKNQGFTLIELAIVILIGGILLGLLTGALSTYLEKQSIGKTKNRLELLQERLVQFQKVNGRYPCVARLDAVPDDAAFGREIGGNCAAGAQAGTTINGGVRVGMIPVRTLGLPHDMAGDSWGRKLTYAVTGILADETTYTHDGGLIEINDAAGASLTNPQNEGHFVIVSHGKSGDGGIPILSDNFATPRANCGGGARDHDNCDDDNEFVDTLVNVDEAGARFFDDYLVFQGQTSPVLAFPENAVMAFNGPCPSGWSNYTDAEGRFIIGASGTDLTMTEYEATEVSPANNEDVNISQGQPAGDGDAELNIPPYLPLTYCQKN